MEIGTEISKKIRSAIKAKLIEQGAYVDDELPDYIMVMVANKKTQKQMTDDLSLFLGANTEKFSSWLHGLLKKLQSINSETTATTTKHKSKEKHKGEKKKRKSSQSEKTAAKETTEKPTEAEAGEVKTKRKSVGEKEKSVGEKGAGDGESTEPTQVKKVKPAPAVETVLSTEINISENTDEFAEEAKEIAKKEKSKPTGKTPPTKVSKTDKSHDVKKKTASKEHHSKSKPESSSSATKVKHHEESRKKPTSFVAAVKRKYEEEEEEEYDPTNPAVGSMASVVHGPARKSSVPKSLQANKSLLMKAVSEAEKSVTVKKKPEYLYESSEGMKSDHKPKSLKHRLKTPAALQLVSRSKRKETEHKMSRSSSVEEGTERKSGETFENLKYVVKNEKVSPKKISPNAKLAAAALRSISQTKAAMKEDTPSGDDLSDNEEYGPPLPDMRLVHKRHPSTESPSTEVEEEELKEEDPLEADNSTPDSDEEQPAMTDPEIQTLLQEANNAMIDLNDLNEDIKYDDRNSNAKRMLPSKEPRFIVTLDGVDPSTYKPMPETTTSKSNPVHPVKPLPKKPFTAAKPIQSPVIDQMVEQAVIKPVTPTMVKPFNINLKDSDDDDERETEEMDTAETDHKPQVLERCRFWPACSNGNACQYIHPSVPCKTFPYCKFGDKCIYIHPNCRFDSQCTRHDCPFTHSSKRKALASATVIHKILQVPMQSFLPPRLSAPVSMQPPSSQCKFFPNCKNMSCPFIHPKPCRYGIGCMNKSTCTFHHPPLPGKEKLKWTSSTQKLTSLTAPTGSQEGAEKS